jgi:hypothetical protein
VDDDTVLGDSVKLLRGCIAEPADLPSEAYHRDLETEAHLLFFVSFWSK